MVVGITGDKLCPVSAICLYLMLRGDKKGSFFLDPDGKAVCKPWFVEQLRSILGSIGAPMPAIASGSEQLPLQQWPVSRITPSSPWGDGIVRPSCNTLELPRNAWHASQSHWPRPANRRPSRHCWGCGGHHTPCMHMSHFIHVVIVSLLSFVLN